MASTLAPRGRRRSSGAVAARRSGRAGRPRGRGRACPRPSGSLRHRRSRLRRRSRRAATTDDPAERCAREPPHLAGLAGGVGPDPAPLPAGGRQETFGDQVDGSSSAQSRRRPRASRMLAPGRVSGRRRRPRPGPASTVSTCRARRIPRCWRSTIVSGSSAPGSPAVSWRTSTRVAEPASRAAPRRTSPPAGRCAEPGPPPRDRAAARPRRATPRGAATGSRPGRRATQVQPAEADGLDALARRTSASHASYRCA